MGQCGGRQSEEVQAMRRQDKQLNQANKKRKNDEEQIAKVLLLGTGESGKSTVFKQMKLQNKVALKQGDLSRGARLNITEAMKELIDQSLELSEDQKIEGCMIRDENFGVRDHITSVHEEEGYDCKWNEELLSAYLQLWNDEGIQTTFANRSLFQLQDNVDYFMENLERLVHDDWELTEDDMVRVRIRTTGLLRQRFIAEGETIEMLDVGGQRNERKKWIHQFQDVSAVIFVTAMSEYDQVLFEDQEENRMRESMTLFEQLSQSHWFAKSTLVLFMNKRDLFEIKFPKVSLSVCFNDWDESDDPEKGIEFLRDKFRNLVPDGRDLIIHVTTATDKNNMKTVMKGVQVAILKEELKKSGLML